MTKYYRVKKPTFMWEEGAILSNERSSGGYVAIEDVWNTVPLNGEYISSDIIENNPEWFERVYKGSVDKMLFITAEALKETFSGFKK